jgi:hypothetical protein
LAAIDGDLPDADNRTVLHLGRHLRVLAADDIGAAGGAGAQYRHGRYEHKTLNRVSHVNPFSNAKNEG